MERKKLEELGISSEHINAIMAQHGSDIEQYKNEIQRLTESNNQITEQLKQFEGVDVGELNEKIKELVEDAEEQKKQYESELTEAKFNSALQSAILENNGRNPKAIAALLDIETLKVSNNRDNDVKNAIAELAKNEPYLFKSEESKPTMKISTGTMHSDTGSSEPDMNDLIRGSVGTEGE